MNSVYLSVFVTSRHSFLSDLNSIVKHLLILLLFRLVLVLPEFRARELC